jgi:hypothetical protein
MRLLTRAAFAKKRQRTWSLGWTLTAVALVERLQRLSRATTFMLSILEVAVDAREPSFYFRPRLVFEAVPAGSARTRGFGGVSSISRGSSSADSINSRRFALRAADLAIEASNPSYPSRGTDLISILV